MNEPTKSVRHHCVMVDGTALHPRMKGVGRYAWQLCDALEREMPAGGRLMIAVFDGILPAFREGFLGEFIRLPYSSELALGLRVFPRLLVDAGADAFIRPADKIGTRYGVPTLTVCHDVNPMIWAVQPARPIKRRLIDGCWEFLRGRALRCSERVVCNSEFIRDAATRQFHLDPGKTEVGYCGVDPRIPELASAAAAGAMRQRIDKQGFLLAFATGDEREGYDILPQLWAAARNCGYPGSLVIAGLKDDLPYAARLKQAFQAHGVAQYVQFMPFLGEAELPTLAGLYAAADFYLETSLHEGFGMQLVEAMACATPCFSSGRGALLEVGGGYPLALDIANPAAAGMAVTAAWQRGEHRRDHTAQVSHATRFDWSEARKAVVDFAWG